jgi:hypothetical protein
LVESDEVRLLVASAKSGRVDISFRRINESRDLITARMATASLEHVDAALCAVLSAELRLAALHLRIPCQLGARRVGAARMVL